MRYLLSFPSGTSHIVVDGKRTACGKPVAHRTTLQPVTAVCARCTEKIRAQS
jgi:hypothetical protein